MVQIFFFFLLIFNLSASIAQASPGKFSYEGRLYDNSGNPATQNVSFLIQIYDASGSCLLRSEETTSQNLSTTSGYFSFDVGTGTLNSDDPGLSFSQIFSNSGSIMGRSGCTYTPSRTDQRLMRVSVKDGSSTTTLSPDVQIGSSPFAVEAEQIQGHQVQNLLRGNRNSNINELTDTQITEFLNLINGTSSKYLTNSTTNGVSLPQFTSSVPPSSPSSGNVWYDSTSKQIKYYDGSSTISLGNSLVASTTSGTIGGSTSINSSGSITTSSNITASGNIQTNGQIKLLNSSANSASLRAPSSVFSNYTLTLPTNTGASGQYLATDGSGTLSWASPSTTTLSGDVSGSSTSTSVDKIKGASVSSTAPTTSGQVLRWNGTNYAPNFVSITDLRSTITGASSLSTSCTAAQTFTYSSGSDSLACSNIAIAPTQVTGLSSAYIAQGGNSLGDVVTIGTNDAFDLGIKTNATNRIYIKANGYVGLGTTVPTSPLTVLSNSTPSSSSNNYGQTNSHTFFPSSGFSGSTTGLYNASIVTQSASNTGNYSGVVNNILINGSASTTGVITGVQNTVGLSSLASMANAYSGRDIIYRNFDYTAATVYGRSSEIYDLAISNTNSITTAVASQGVINTSNGGIITTGIGVKSSVLSNGTSQIVNGYGFLLDTQTGTTSNYTNFYGLYLPSLFASSTTYGIYQAGPSNKNYFAGNVGIGIVSPAYQLDVNGDINTSSSLHISGTQICTSAGCTSSSDLRLKESIQPLSNSLEKILSLQGVEYDWKDKKRFSDRHQIGLIAQDLEKVFPEVVLTDPKSGLKSVAYDHLIAPMIEAFKDLHKLVFENQSKNQEELSRVQRELASLKSHADDLQSENTQIKARLDALEKRLTDKNGK